MGREANITFEQVCGIADSIQAEGGRPTLRTVRERLGTGSLGTVSKMIQQWKGSQDRRATTDLALPPALQRALLDFMGTEIAAARAPLETDIADYQSAAGDLATENERQAATIRDQAAQIEAVTSAKAEAEGKATQLTSDLATARDEITRERQAAEGARIELAKTQLRLEGLPRLESEITALRTDLDRERQGRTQAAQEAAVWKARAGDLRERLDETKIKSR